MAPFELEESYEDSVVNIKVVGIGGGGNNAVNHMIESGVRGAEFIAINTDKQALIKTPASNIIPIGDKVTKGQGAGADPTKGFQAATESVDEIEQNLKGADMVFITAGMGGGTGTGAAPVVAKVAQDMGILTVGVVTKPFFFESKVRMAQAEKGIEELSKCVDSLIVIPNERLKVIETGEKLTLKNAFKIADDVLKTAVQSIAELITVNGYVNLDFADVSSIMKDSGIAHMGVGQSEGKDKAELAAKMAISSPLLETSIMGARGIIVNVTVSPDIGLEDVDEAMTMIQSEIHEDASLIFGVAFDETFADKMHITVIATSFEDQPATRTQDKINETAGQRVSTPYSTARPSASSQTHTASSQQQPKNTNQDKDNLDNDAASAEDADDFDNIMDLLTPKSNKKNLFE